VNARRLIAEETAEVNRQIESGEATFIVCWSRCLWCGRKTPHEVCHEHGRAFNPTDEEMEAFEGWPNYELEPEQCDKSDEECAAA
jgi:hypothetical protein